MKGDELRPDFLRQIFSGDNPLEITTSRIDTAILSGGALQDVPEVALPSQHPFACIDAISLEIHLLE